MEDVNNQVEYWDAVAWQKEFTHGLDLTLLRDVLPLDSRILDFGCGYGRTCRELSQAGYRDVLGIDSSAEMIRRGREQWPELRLEVLGAEGIAHADHSFDAVFLLAVLTCIPEDQAQLGLLAELKRLLRPGGLLYISDYLLQSDAQNLQRYQQHAAEFGTYGVFRLPEGAVVRHHARPWLDKLTAGFQDIDVTEVEALTMNGHPARTVRYLGRITRDGAARRGNGR